jgi:acyl-homoserine-lactone acylase
MNFSYSKQIVQFHSFICSICIFVCFAFPHVLLKADAQHAERNTVEIIWDIWGVPHIYAPDENSMFYAFGWAQMESHAEAILRLYGEARGRAAEYWGEQYAQSDSYLRTMGLPELAASMTKAQEPGFKKCLESFASGMNEYAEQHINEISPELRQVLPVTVQDQMAHTIRLVHFTFLGMNDMKSAEKWNQMGSNGWAIGPGHSASGHAMLLINPHLGWSDFFRWYEVHLSSPGYDAYGICFIGIPVMKIAFNENMGWTYTVNTIDACDLYELKLKDGGYIYDGKVVEFKKRSDIIKIKNTDGTVREEAITLLSSIHGPVISVKGGKALAIRIASLDQPGFLQQQYDMAKCVDLKQFEAVLRRMQVPMFNLLYADRDGHITYLFGGRIPRRSIGDFNLWQGILDGTTSGTLWTDTHPFEDLPYVVDPDTGWLQNANDPPWFCTYPSPLSADKYPAYFAPRDLPFRPQKSIKLLMSGDKISFDELLKLTSSTQLELADRLLDDLVDAVMAHGDATAKEAMKVLAAWDRSADACSRGSMLFQNWITELGEDYFKIPWDEKRPIETPEGLKDPKAAVEALERAIRITRERFGSLDVEWGKVNKLKVASKEFPGIGSSGLYGIFNVIKYKAGENGISYSVAGGTSCFVVEFSKPLKAKGLTIYGNSTRKDSKHIGDQLGLFADKQYRDIYFTKQEVANHLEKREILRIQH